MSNVDLNRLRESVRRTLASPWVVYAHTERITTSRRCAWRFVFPLSFFFRLYLVCISRYTHGRDIPRASKFRKVERRRYIPGNNCRIYSPK